MDYIAVKNQTVYRIAYESEKIVADGETFTGPEEYVIKKDLGTVAQALVCAMEKNLSMLRKHCPEIWQSASASAISLSAGLLESLEADSLETAAELLAEKITSASGDSETDEKRRRQTQGFVNAFPTVIQMYDIFRMLSEIVELDVEDDFFSRSSGAIRLLLPLSGGKLSCTLGILDDELAVLYAPRSLKEYLQVLLFEYLKGCKDVRRIGVCAVCKKVFVRKSANAVTCSKVCSRKKYENEKRKASSFYKLVRNYNNRIASAEPYFALENAEKRAERKRKKNQFQLAVDKWHCEIDKIMDNSKKERRYTSFRDSASSKTKGNIDALIQELEQEPADEDSQSIYYIKQVRELWKELDLENLCKTARTLYPKFQRSKKKEKEVTDES